jgi:hypothetical protein
MSEPGKAGALLAETVELAEQRPGADLAEFCEVLAKQRTAIDPPASAY